MPRKTVLTTLAAVLTTGLAATPAMALECPVLHPNGGTGVIKETQANIAAYQKSLMSSDAGNAISSAIFELRKKYPGVSDEELVNYLTTIYCPAVLGAGYDAATARAKIDHFDALLVVRLADAANSDAPNGNKSKSASPKS